MRDHLTEVPTFRWVITACQRLWLELAWICALYKFCNTGNNNNNNSVINSLIVTDWLFHYAEFSLKFQWRKMRHCPLGWTSPLRGLSRSCGSESMKVYVRVSCCPLVVRRHRGYGGSSSFERGCGAAVTSCSSRPTRVWCNYVWEQNERRARVGIAVLACDWTSDIRKTLSNTHSHCCSSPDDDDDDALPFCIILLFYNVLAKHEIVRKCEERRLDKTEVARCRV